ncbi:10255_t:CDS:2, partial [Acaulospora colombiana]
MSLVGLLPPLSDNGKVLVDGGYVDNLPVAAMQSMGTSSVFAIDVGSFGTLQFGQYDEISKVGYTSGLEMISVWESEGRLPTGLEDGVEPSRRRGRATPPSPIEIPNFLQNAARLANEGTDTSQGSGQLLSNISACLAIADTLSTTLGPRGMDKLIVNDRGEAQITNDGATILKLLEIVHPAAKTLVDIARAQDAEVGDGTTSVVLLAAQFLKEIKGYIEEGMSPHVIIKGYRLAAQMAVDRIKEIQVSIDKSDSDQKPFFANMVVDAVMSLDQDDLDESLIGVKRISGGGMQ